MRKRTQTIAINMLLAVYFVSAVEPSSPAQEVKRSAAPSSPSGAFAPGREVVHASIGRDLSNLVRAGHTRPTAEKCEIVRGESRSACMRGIVYALIGNTWDGRYALPFCAALSQEDDRNTCFQTSAHYLKSIFEKSPAEIAKDCTEHLSQPARCVELSLR